jgi:hypothetical protein
VYNELVREGGEMNERTVTVNFADAVEALFALRNRAQGFRGTANEIERRGSEVMVEWAAQWRASAARDEATANRIAEAVGYDTYEAEARAETYEAMNEAAAA